MIGRLFISVIVEVQRAKLLFCRLGVQGISPPVQDKADRARHQNEVSERQRRNYALAKTKRKVLVETYHAQNRQVEVLLSHKPEDSAPNQLRLDCHYK